MKKLLLLFFLATPNVYCGQPHIMQMDREDKSTELVALNTQLQQLDKTIITKRMLGAWQCAGALCLLSVPSLYSPKVACVGCVLACVSCCSACGDELGKKVTLLNKRYEVEAALYSNHKER